MNSFEKVALKKQIVLKGHGLSRATLDQKETGL
jgi:hypothetical protein